MSLRSLLLRLLCPPVPPAEPAQEAPLSRCPPPCGTLFSPANGATRCAVCAGDACPRCGRATKERRCPRPACKRLATMAKAAPVVRMAGRGR